MNIEENSIFTILNALHDRRDKIAFLLNSFEKSDYLLNNIYRNELTEIDELIKKFTR